MQRHTIHEALWERHAPYLERTSTFPGSRQQLVLEFKPFFFPTATHHVENKGSEELK